MEGLGTRGASRVAGVSPTTVSKLLRDVGQAARVWHDSAVWGLRPLRVECDEIWSYAHCREETLPKAKAPPPDAGEVYTWTALDSDSRLLIAWAVGDRERDVAMAFMHDLRGRIDGRVQISTDGFRAYITAVEEAFGSDADFAQIVKVTGSGMTEVISGSPQLPISTSLVERHNLTIRMGLRRYSRKTNAHSKLVDYHRWHSNIFFTWYNFVRPHQSLGTTPAVVAGLADAPYTLEWLVALSDQMAEQVDWDDDDPLAA